MIFAEVKAGVFHSKTIAMENGESILRVYMEQREQLRIAMKL
jgi:hypothetical protein